MSLTHRDHLPGDHLTRLANHALPDPLPPRVLSELGIRLKALSIGALMFLCAGPALWSWLG